MTSLDRFRIATSRGGTNELRCDQHPDQLLATWHDTMPLTQILKFAFSHNLEHHRDDEEGDAWPNPDPAVVEQAWRDLVPPEVRRDLALRRAEEAAREIPR